MLRLRPDLVVTRSKLERLTPELWLSIVTVARPCREAGTCSETTIFALPKGYDPRKDGGRYAADQISEYYEKEAT